jgi:hypothetical protein
MGRHIDGPDVPNGFGASDARADRVDLSEIDTRQLVKRAANLEARLIVAGLFPRPRAWQRAAGAGALAASV